MSKKIFATTLALCFSFNAFGADFKDADSKFAIRDTSLQATLDARAAYQSLLDQGLAGDDLLRAGTGYIRTLLFEGTHYNNLNTEQGKKSRKQIFSSIQNIAVEIINPSKLGFESPAYYYFKASALAYEAEVSGILDRLMLLPKLNAAISTGLATQGGATFEGGGILRVKAAVKGNPEAKGIPGVYNPTEALKLAEDAIASEAFPGNAEGTLFCENFRRKVGIQIELGLKTEALITAEKTLADFRSYLDDGLLPEFIRAETSDCLLTVAELKNSLGSAH